MGTDDANEEQQRTDTLRRRRARGRNASPWSRRIVFGTILVVVLLAPLWIDPLTLATIRGGRSTPGPGAQDTIEPLDALPVATDDPSLVWTQVARDGFTRTVTAGWGTADIGGAWQSVGQTAALSVDGSAGRGTTATSGLALMTLPAVDAHDGDVTFSVTLPSSAPAAELVVGAVLRRTTEGVGYLAEARIAADGTLRIAVELFDATGAHALSVPYVVRGFTATPGTAVRVRAQVTGIDPATIKVKAWPAAAAEPKGWQYGVVDWTGVLQRTGSMGIGWISTQINIDDFTAASADTGATQ